jgi:hypothetical protein
MSQKVLLTSKSQYHSTPFGLSANEKHLDFKDTILEFNQEELFF